jgi:hypothetical protein
MDWLNESAWGQSEQIVDAKWDEFVSLRLHAALGPDVTTVDWQVMRWASA